MRIPHLVKTSGAVIMASAMIQPVLSTVSMAATANVYQSYPTHLYIDGTLVSSPKHIVAKDPWGQENTSWVPIYYLQQGLNLNGVESAWNGRDLTLIPPSGWTMKYTPTPQPRALQKGQMDFMVDGTQFAIAPTIVTADPASGIQTTYIPIYYAKRFLTKRFGMQVTWDGVNWQLNSPSVLLPKSEIDAVMKATTETKYPTEHFAALFASTQVVATDGGGGTLTAIVGTRYPTADGYGQLVFFWHNGHFVGLSDTTEANEILSVKPGGTGTFTVTYANYKSTDPMVHPSLPPQTVTYAWNGATMTPSTALQPGVTNRIAVTPPTQPIPSSLARLRY